MSKRELIEAIRRHNRTVKTEFLERFEERDLQAYLDRVCSVNTDTPPPRAGALDKQELIVA
jgi:hypothetical protein